MCILITNINIIIIIKINNIFFILVICNHAGSHEYFIMFQVFIYETIFIQYAMILHNIYDFKLEIFFKTSIDPVKILCHVIIVHLISTINLDL